MSSRSTPPFRADHVGSFLRPKYLLEAREQKAKGEISAGRAAQGRGPGDRRDRQVPGGRRPAGDHRRRVPPHLLPHRLPRAARRRQDRHPGDDQEARRHRGARAAGDARDRQGAPREGHPARRLRVPEVPAPRARRRSRFRRRRCCTSAAAAPASASSTIRSSSPISTTTSPRPTATSCSRCPTPGCTYVQMDDTNLAYLCDDKMREAARARGDDPNELPHRYAKFINRVVAQKPAGMTLAMHLCRGNFQSTWAAQGGYEPVAEALLSEMNLDAYFLEYDDERSGDFRPLRFLPKGKIVVLGLVTTKLGALEKQGRPQAPHRRGGEVRAARAARAQPAVRLLQHRARQQHRRRGAARQAAPGDRDRRRGLGQGLAPPDVGAAARVLGRGLRRGAVRRAAARGDGALRGRARQGVRRRGLRSRRCGRDHRQGRGTGDVRCGRDRQGGAALRDARHSVRQEPDRAGRRRFGRRGALRAFRRHQPGCRRHRRRAVPRAGSRALAFPGQARRRRGRGAREAPREDADGRAHAAAARGAGDIRLEGRGLALRNRPRPRGVFHGRDAMPAGCSSAARAARCPPMERRARRSPTRSPPSSASRARRSPGTAYAMALRGSAPKPPSSRAPRARSRATSRC